MSTLRDVFSFVPSCWGGHLHVVVKRQEQIYQKHKCRGDSMVSNVLHLACLWPFGQTRKSKNEQQDDEAICSWQEELTDVTQARIAAIMNSTECTCR